MKKMSKLALRFHGAVAALALSATAANVNATCAGPAHQPVLPAGAEKLKKV